MGRINLCRALSPGVFRRDAFSLIMDTLKLQEELDLFATSHRRIKISAPVIYLPLKFNLDAILFYSHRYVEV